MGQNYGKQNRITHSYIDIKDKTRTQRVVNEMGTCDNTQTEAEMCMDTHRHTHTYRYNDQDTHIQKDSTRKTDICEDICLLIHTKYE